MYYFFLRHLLLWMLLQIVRLLHFLIVSSILKCSLFFILTIYLIPLLNSFTNANCFTVEDFVVYKYTVMSSTNNGMFLFLYTLPPFLFLYLYLLFLFLVYYSDQMLNRRDINEHLCFFSNLMVKKFLCFIIITCGTCCRFYIDTH